MNGGVYIEDLRLLKPCCEKILTASSGSVPWGWDEQFVAVLGQVEDESAPTLQRTIEEMLPKAWEAETLGDAPDYLAPIVEHLGGLWPGQKLFVTDTTGSASLVAAWWPWETGPRSSLRFFVWNKKEAEANFANELRDWFGIPPG